MTVLDEKLEPCPFCGDDNAMVLGPTCRPETPYNPADRLFPIVRCGSCCAEVSGDNEDYRGKSAIAAWNRRALTSLPSTGVKVMPLNDLARKSSLFIDNAAVAAQNDFDEVTREAIELNIIAPLILEISERDQILSCITPSVDPAGTGAVEALREAEAGLVFAGAERDIPEGNFIPAPTLALRIVRAALAASTGAGASPGQAPGLVEALSQIRNASGLDAVVQDAPAAAMARFAEIHQVADSTLASLAPQGGEGAE